MIQSRGPSILSAGLPLWNETAAVHARPGHAAALVAMDQVPISIDIHDMMHGFSLTWYSCMNVFSSLNMVVTNPFRKLFVLASFFSYSRGIEYFTPEKRVEHSCGSHVRMTIYTYIYIYMLFRSDNRPYTTCCRALHIYLYIIYVPFRSMNQTSLSMAWSAPQPPKRNKKSSEDTSPSVAFRRVCTTHAWPARLDHGGKGDLSHVPRIRRYMYI